MFYPQSVKDELFEHVKDLVRDEVLTLENQDEWHHLAFDEDYYIIGYYQCEQWLKKHGLSAYEAIYQCIEYEKDNFGKVFKSYEDAETTVNMLVYAIGGEIIYENEDELKALCHAIAETPSK